MYAIRSYYAKRGVRNCPNTFWLLSRFTDRCAGLLASPHLGRFIINLPSYSLFRRNLELKTWNLKLVNLHSHFELPTNQLGLVNHSVLLPFEPKDGQRYSAGLHPWDLDEATDDNWLQMLEVIIQNPQVLAIGECGVITSYSIHYTKLYEEESVFEQLFG